MSVGLSKKFVAAKAPVTQESYDCGALSGEDSDMNVQATGIAPLDDSPFLNSNSPIVFLRRM
jgi:hypothetical protein